MAPPAPPASWTALLYSLPESPRLLGQPYGVSTAYIDQDDSLLRKILALPFQLCRLGSMLLWLGLAWLEFCPLVWVLVFSICCFGGFVSCVFSVPDLSGDPNDVQLLFGLVCPYIKSIDNRVPPRPPPPLRPLGPCCGLASLGPLGPFWSFGPPFGLALLGSSVLSRWPCGGLASPLLLPAVGFRGLAFPWSFGSFLVLWSPFRFSRAGSAAALPPRSCSPRLVFALEKVIRSLYKIHRQ